MLGSDVRELAELFSERGCGCIKLLQSRLCMKSKLRQGMPVRHGEQKIVSGFLYISIHFIE